MPVNLPFFRKKPSAPGREYLYALEINSSFVKSAVWSVINDRTQVLSVGQIVPWDNQTSDSLLQASDSSLSDAAGKLDAAGKISPDKVILGVPVDWVSQEKILPEKLKLLKIILTRLSLSAVGFVITAEAVVHFLEHSEGVKPTAVLIGVWEHYLEISLVRLGKIDGVHLIHRSGTIVADVLEGLARFPNIDMFPSRILLYDSGLNLEGIRQSLLAHPWQAPQTRLSFLHFPKIEILASDFSVRAVALSGGDEVARAIGLLSPSVPEPVVPPATALSQESPPSAAGVALDSDLTDAAANLGFSATPLPDSPPASSFPEFTEEQFNQVAAPITSAPATFKFFRLPRFHFPRPRLPAGPLILIPLLLILIAAGLFAAWWNLPKAVVTLTVVPRTLQHQFSFTAAPDAVFSLDQLTLPARKLEVGVSGDKTTPATGSKLVGDKATGTISLINGTSSVRNFPAGTTITSPSGLKFTTDSPVNIASASGTADPNSYQPGKADVKVTAAQIGSDSNLSAGTQFRVGTFSTLDFVAKNDVAFSGGSSRQAKVISRDDLAGLRTELTASLKDQASSQLSSQISPSESIITESIQIQTTAEQFNHKVDEVADELTLSLTIKATGLAYAKADFSQLVKAQVNSKIPADYELQSDPETSLTLSKYDKSTASFTVNASASLLPKFNKTTIITALTGKNPAAANSYLQNLPAVSRVDYSFTPPLPARLLTLPHLPSHISLIVTASP